jgi:hypothetical protein
VAPTASARNAFQKSITDVRYYRYELTTPHPPLSHTTAAASRCVRVCACGRNGWLKFLKTAESHD